MLRTRSCVVDGSSPAAAQPGGQPGVVAAQAAQLHVAARGQLHGAVAEILGAAGEHLQRRGVDRAAGQPDPGQRAVGRVVQGEHPGTGVGADADTATL